MKEIELYVITAIYEDRTRPSNIFLSKKEAIECVESNFFDIWEGYTNEYVVIEKMPPGCPWMVEEIAWYGRERVDSETYYNENGQKCIDRKGYVFEIDKPKKFKSTCNFGIG